MTWDDAYNLRDRLIGQPMSDSGALTTVQDVELTDSRFGLIGEDFTCAVSRKYGSVAVRDGVLCLTAMYGVPDARVPLKGDAAVRDGA